MAFSSIGPWALGGVMATLGKTSVWYKISIYFYLHFQYNAWFILSLIGIFFYFLEKKRLLPEVKTFNSFVYLLHSGIILSFFLSVLWTEPHWSLYILAGAGAILQGLSFIKFYRMIKPFWQELSRSMAPNIRVMLGLVWFLLTGKLLLQVFSAFPYFAKLAFTYTDFVIGYLHWTFLGVVSIALFAFLQMAGLLQVSRSIFWAYFIGFLLSEFLIFYKAAALWLGLAFFADYFWMLTLISALIPISVGMLLIRNLLTS